MQICQVITVLGLCLSQARALVVTPPHDDAIKSLVNLVTQPEASLEKSPMFSDVADALHQKAHSIPQQEFDRQLISTVQPLLEDDKKGAVYIAASFVGYRQTLATRELDPYPAVKAKRLQLYRNSLYSQLKDLAHRDPKKFNAESLEKAQARLVGFLSQSGGAEHSGAEALLAKVHEEIIHPVKPIAGAELEELPREAINEQLKITHLDGVPDAPLIDGRFMQKSTSQQLPSLSSNLFSKL